MLAALPWVGVLSVAWSIGECAGYAIPPGLRAAGAGADIEAVRTS
jgi:hypothetical protein